jgi:hypothetical protein
MAQDFEMQLRILRNVVPDTRNLVLFVGAGVSVSAGYSLWGKATTDALNLSKGRGLLSPGAISFAAEELEKFHYYDVFEMIQRQSAEAAYYAVIKDIFCKQLPPSEIHKLLVRVPCRGIITTNFDECLSTACVTERKVLPISEISVAMSSDQFFIVKPHGSILNPKTMVLTSQDWRKVEANREFGDILAQSVSNGQLIFLGYGFKDPDFDHAWSHLLAHRVFRHPPVFCCPEKSLAADLQGTFRERNVQVLEFADDGSFEFLPAVLSVLAEPKAVAIVQVATNAQDIAARDLEKYVFICMQFSPTQKDRLVLVAKAIALEVVSTMGDKGVNRSNFLQQICDTLGSESEAIRNAGDTAMLELREVGLLSERDGLIRANADKVQLLTRETERIEKREWEWVGHGLRELAAQLNQAVEPEDQVNILRILDGVLLELGRDLADLFLFNRPPRDESERIDEIVDEYCKNAIVSQKKQLYRKTVRRLLFEPQEKEEDILFKKLQAYFISTAYILNPTSERLLAQYARNHHVYFDSSIILPALAVGHPSNAVYKKLLRRTQALGMHLRIIQDMLNEVWANVRAALNAFTEFRRAPTSVHDALGAYVTLYGTGNGNVFLEGFLNMLDLDPALTAEGYMAMVLGATGGQITEKQVMRAISETYGIELDALQEGEIEQKKLEPIIDSIAHLRKVGGRFKNRKLCEHEARQFYIIHLRREQSPDLMSKIWYVTTDRFVQELQRLERERFPLPISYTPRSWFQYLDLVDFESRGSQHFSRLQPKMRFGVLSGEVGIEAIRTMIQEQKDLLQRGAVNLKEMADAAVRDYHVQQAIAQVDHRPGSDRQGDRSQAAVREQIRQGISQAAGQFVLVRGQELDALKEKATKEREEKEKLEKKLAKQKYVNRTLRAQQKPGKKKKRHRH